jgi:hypothetical protein
MECGETWRADQASKSLRPDLFLFTLRAEPLAFGLAGSSLQCPRTSCLASYPQALAVRVVWQCGQGAGREKEIRLASILASFIALLG